MKLSHSFFILITIAHHDRSVRELVIAFAEKEGLSASSAGEVYGVPKSTATAWLQKYQRDGLLGRRQGTGLWRVFSSAQDAALVAEAQINPFFSARDFEAATNFPGHIRMVILRLKEAALRARCAVVEELLTDEHELYRLAFAESNVDCPWDRVIFSDKAAFSSASDGLVLIYRPQGERYNSRYMSYLHTQWSCVCSLQGLDIS
jgi:hypothetical protein